MNKEIAKKKYLGMENYNNQGFLMKIVDYINANKIIVEFAEPYKHIVKSRVDRFLKGDIQNHNAPSLYGVGIVGYKYPTHASDGKKHLKEYLTWRNMLGRCYDETRRYKNPAYYDVSVCDEWLYYPNFYEWIHNQENYDTLMSINDMAIDKDILIKGNREYRPDRCCLVPTNVNNILLKSDAIRGDLPIGVYYLKRNKKYAAQCGGKVNRTYLGLYSTPEEAFEVYKEFKEKQIKKLAEEEYQKHTIIKACYEALMNYKVEITD